MTGTTNTYFYHYDSPLIINSIVISLLIISHSFPFTNQKTTKFQGILSIFLVYIDINLTICEGFHFYFTFFFFTIILTIEFLVVLLEYKIITLRHLAHERSPL